MKKILLALIMSCSLLCTGATTSEVYIPSETQTKMVGDFGYLSLCPTEDINQMKIYITICEEHKQKARMYAEEARALKIQNLEEYLNYCSYEWWNAHNTKTIYEQKIWEYEYKKTQYPNAAQIWEIMKSYGWNDIICAGILGNMMRECGGDTLSVNPYAQNSHYGLCQWSRQYHPQAWGKDIAGQLEYLKNTLDISVFNNCYTPEDAAEVFCWKYERPSKTDPVSKRRNNARTAYNYFTN